MRDFCSIPALYLCVNRRMLLTCGKLQSLSNPGESLYLLLKLISVRVDLFIHNLTLSVSIDFLKNVFHRDPLAFSITLLA